MIVWRVGKAITSVMLYYTNRFHWLDCCCGGFWVRHMGVSYIRSIIVKAWLVLLDLTWSVPSLGWQSYCHAFVKYPVRFDFIAVCIGTHTWLIPMKAPGMWITIWWPMVITYGGNNMMWQSITLYCYDKTLKSIASIQGERKQHLVYSRGQATCVRKRLREKAKCPCR